MLDTEQENTLKNSWKIEFSVILCQALGHFHKDMKPRVNVCMLVARGEMLKKNYANQFLEY